MSLRERVCSLTSSCLRRRGPPTGQRTYPMTLTFYGSRRTSTSSETLSIVPFSICYEFAIMHSLF